MGSLLSTSVENNYALVECAERHKALSGLVAPDALR